MIQLKNSAQISAMIEAGRITGEALLVAREHIREGISTKELDTVIRNYIEKCGAKPSFLGYGGFHQQQRRGDPWDPLVPEVPS